MSNTEIPIEIREKVVEMMGIAGNIPRDGLELFDHKDFRIFVIPRRTSDRFISLKVISLKKVIGKANFWINWHCEEHRPVRGKPLDEFLECFPDVSREILGLMRKEFSSGA